MNHARSYLHLFVFLLVTVHARGQQNHEVNWSKAGDGVANTKVLRATPPGSRAQTANINVTYHDFPPEAEIAFEYAVSIWEDLLISGVPIDVDVSYEPLEPGVLGGTSTALEYNFDNAPMRWVFYPSSLAESIAAIELNGAEPDITMVLSSEIPWYFGIDGEPASSEFDFVSVVLHELAHGLGYTHTMNVNSEGEGSWGISLLFRTRPKVYDPFGENLTGEQLVDTETFENPSIELGDQLTSSEIYFDGPSATFANGGQRPELYCPEQWELGSSVSHLDEWAYPPGNINSLMTPFLDRDEVVHDPGPVGLGILRDLGWNIESVQAHPVVADIPDQLVAPGETFTAIRMDDYVIDSDDPDSEITWSWTGNNSLSVRWNADQRRIRIRYPNGWTGSETITFTATDPDGNTDSDAATFTVGNLGDALVAHYPFSGNANDVSGNDNHLAVFGATLTSDRFGNANSAYHFNGSSDYMLKTGGMNFTSQYSMSAWTKREDISVYALVVDVGGPTTDARIHYDPVTNTAGYDTWIGGASGAYGTTPIPVGEWVHLAGVRNGANWSLYVNGQLDATATATAGTMVNQNVAISKHPGYPQYYFKGDIDDIRLYERALTPVEVLNLYNEGATSTNWTNQTSGTTQWLEAVHFADANTGWAVGWGGTILHTSNGGSNWDPQTSGTTEILASVYFANALNGWAVGHGGSILRTTNGGSSWNPQASGGTSSEHHWVHFSDVARGWVVGESGSIFRTTNGGVNWTSQTSGTTVDLNSVQFMSPGIGWAVGHSGTILKTTNRGLSWIPQTSGTTASLFSVHFADLNTGWAAGDGGTVLHTTNGGSTWSIQTSGASVRLEGVHFTNTNTGWVVGDGGTILRTTDGGLSWSPDPSGTSWRIYAVHFPLANSGWAVGANGTILHYGSGATLPIVPNALSRLNEEDDIPTVFSLSQNYPNPFNPSTSITYELPVDAYVTLIVSDIMGREVSRLVDGPEAAGHKSVTFDARNLASGVYFYRLKAGSFVETRKLVLMK